jgi:uncharacterized protein (DUF58 family)
MRGWRAVLAAALGVVVLFVSSRPVQFLALLYLVVLGLSWAYSRLTARYVVAGRKREVLRAQRFEPIEITLVVENRCPLPVPTLSVMDTPNHFFASEPGYFLIALRGGERKILRYTLESQSRGEYTLGPVVLKGSDPLGLFPWNKRYAERQRLVVYPEILPLRLESRSGLPAGNIRARSPIYEDVTRYSSLREYLPGDDLRRISWKASARTGRLTSMAYLPMLYAPVLILLNLMEEDYPLRYRSHRLERAITLAASLVVHFLGLGQEIGLLAAASLPGGGGLPAAAIRGTAAHATELLELLARVEAAREPMDFTQLPAASGMEVPVRTRVVAITPALSVAQAGRLAALRRAGCAVEVFLVGGESAHIPEEVAPTLPVHKVSDYGQELLLHE